MHCALCLSYAGKGLLKCLCYGASQRICLTNVEFKFWQQCLKHSHCCMHLKYQDSTRISFSCEFVLCAFYPSGLSWSIANAVTEGWCKTLLSYSLFHWWHLGHSSWYCHCSSMWAMSLTSNIIEIIMSYKNQSMRSKNPLAM